MSSTRIAIASNVKAESSIFASLATGVGHPLAHAGSARGSVDALCEGRKMTIADARAQLERATTTSRRLCEAALMRAQDPHGEGRTTFTELFPGQAMAAAEAADRLRAAGVDPGALGGIPVSVKDLFDVAGLPTRAGAARVRAAVPPAGADAAAVARLRRAGAAIVGKTNMTEFAYSGLGLNPHYGTPRNPYDRKTGRIPGGSSSGAAVSVTDGMAAAAIGTDTGGSVRIPAALCGLAGFKPTARRVPRDGCFPLSDSFDSIGPIALDVSDCALLDAILAGEDPVVPVPRSAAGLRFLAPSNVVFDRVDHHVAAAFERAVDRLARAGAHVDRSPLPLLDRYAAEGRAGRQLAAEAFWLHRAELAAFPERFDPRVSGRMLAGESVSAAEYIERLRWRAGFIADFRAAFAGYDAVVWPTVAVVAPLLAELAFDDDAYADANLLVLRNTTIVNVADGCALTVPMHDPGEPPAGFQLAAPSGHDRRLLACGSRSNRSCRARTKINAACENWGDSTGASPGQPNEHLQTGDCAQGVRSIEACRWSCRSPRALFKCEPWSSVRSTKSRVA